MEDKEFEIKSEKHRFTNQVANDSKYFKSRFSKDVTDSTIKLFLRYKIDEGALYDGVYCTDSIAMKYNKNFEDKINNMIANKSVTYEIVNGSTKFSTDLIIELLQSQTFINNTIDFGRPLLYFYGKYFEVGTEFRLKDGEILTRDKSNFGYRFKDGDVIGMISWIDLDC